MPDELIRVLVIDDDTEVVDMIRAGLEPEGMKVHCASDGAQGIEVLGREQIDVVVLDIMMPRVDGWMCLMDIRNQPTTADVPVIMLSAKTQDLAKILAFKQGIQQYVTKPFNVLELAARIESLVKSRRATVGQSSGESEFRKLAVRRGGRTVLLNIDDIVFLSTRNKCTYAHTYENQYLLDTTLGVIEDKFSRETFVRVHRSYLVNLNKVKEILRMRGNYVIVVADRDETHIPIARRQVKTFREVVGI